MNPKCRIVVAIPAYNEGSRIKNTLEQFTKQDLNPNLFEIIVFATPFEGDTTESEVLKFKEQYPQVSVIFANNPLDKNEPMTLGNHRRYATDIAAARILNRGQVKEDTILLSNDADTVAIDENYLSSILDELDRNPLEDGLVTNVKIPAAAMAKPNVAAGFSLIDTFEKTFALGDIGEGEEKIPEPAITNGPSTAVRASIYAAVGGYNPQAVIAEAWELGWLIADAGDWNPDRIKYNDKTGLITDPRRFLDAVANRVPVDQQLLDFQTRPELRGLNNEQILDHIPDSFDWELFQDDVDSVWYSQYSGSNNRIGKRRFELIFKATMEKLGVEYKIDTIDGHEAVKLINVDRLLNHLAKLVGKKSIEIVHSQPRVYTPEMISQLKNFFSTTTGVIEARSAKAERIASDIRSAQATGEENKLPQLMSEYERFAGHNYTTAAVAS